MIHFVCTQKLLKKVGSNLYHVDSGIHLTGTRRVVRTDYPHTASFTSQDVSDGALPVGEYSLLRHNADLHLIGVLFVQK